MATGKLIYGIIGNPLEHSLSPAMHNAAFKALGVDAIYKTFPLEEEELGDFFSELKEPASPIFGLNVTVPYKEKVLSYLDSLAPLAEKIRAVNTIVVENDRRLIGYNTDAPGFMAHLAELNWTTKGKRVAILGAGGAARAIITTLCLIPERPTSMKIYNRTLSRSEELIRDLGGRLDIGCLEIVPTVDDLNIELTDILINTTSLGLHIEDDILIDSNLLHSNMLVYDLIYNPPETKLLRMAKAKGATTSNGLGMLYYQGVLAFQHWTSMQLQQDIKDLMRKALEEALR